jgi:hypothetical protein
MHVRLLSGAIEAAEGTEGIAGASEVPSKVDRKAMLVYAGKFDSMDGPVEITPDHLSRLVETHNGLGARLGRAMGMKDLPPVQLDHSTSAKDTVGRLVGQLEMGSHRLADGSEVPAVFGTVRVLGRENVEKVLDGRWTHLSIGADLETGKISELTITPFPAAKEAAMLAARAALAAQPGPSTKSDPTKTGFTEGENMDKEKLKKHLMEQEKLTAEEAEKKLASMSDEDCAKMAAEIAEHEKKLAEEEKKEHEAKMKAAREKLTKLSAGISGIRLSARTASVRVRLSALRSAAKITPAELKKLDVVALAKLDDTALDAVFKTFDAREPQVMVGMYGSTQAADVSRLAAKKLSEATKAKIEMETRMRLGYPVSDDLKRLAEGAGETEVVVQPGAKAHIDTTPHAHYDMEADYESLKKLMTEGKHDEAKEHLKRMLARASHGPGEEDVKASSDEVKKMQESVAEMSAQLEELTKLIS